MRSQPIKTSQNNRETIIDQSSRPKRGEDSSQKIIINTGFTHGFRRNWLIKKLFNLLAVIKVWDYFLFEFLVEIISFNSIYFRIYNEKVASCVRILCRWRSKINRTKMYVEHTSNVRNRKEVYWENTICGNKSKVCLFI